RAGIDIRHHRSAARITVPNTSFIADRSLGGRGCLWCAGVPLRSCAPSDLGCDAVLAHAAGLWPAFGRFESQVSATEVLPSVDDLSEPLLDRVNCLARLFLDRP